MTNTQRNITTFSMMTILFSMTMLMISPMESWADGGSDSFTEIKKSFPPLAGGQVEIESSGHDGDVRWI